MTPTERRTALIRLLARFDQEIREVEDLACDPGRCERDRNLAAEQLDFRRRAVIRVEGLWTELSERES